MLKRVAVQPRIAALIISFIGYVFLAVNHRTVLSERHFYPMLLLFGPVCILYGIAGAIEPRIMHQAGAPAAPRVMLYRAITVVIVLVGLAIGFAMAHFWYKIW